MDIWYDMKEDRKSGKNRLENMRYEKHCTHYRARLLCSSLKCQEEITEYGFGKFEDIGGNARTGTR